MCVCACDTSLVGVLTTDDRRSNVASPRAHLQTWCGSVSLLPGATPYLSWVFPVHFSIINPLQTPPLVLRSPFSPFSSRPQTHPRPFFQIVDLIIPFTNFPSFPLLPSSPFKLAAVADLHRPSLSSSVLLLIDQIRLSLWPGRISN